VVGGMWTQYRPPRPDSGPSVTSLLQGYINVTMAHAYNVVTSWVVGISDLAPIRRQLRSPLRLQQVNAKVSINGVEWDSAWREHRVIESRRRCRSTFRVGGDVLASYATISRELDREALDWFPQADDIYCGRVLMFLRCRCYAMAEWQVLAVVSMRKARRGQFADVLCVDGTSQLADCEIISAECLQQHTISLPHSQFRGEPLSIRPLRK
jgi:hypothetical protein